MILLVVASAAIAAGIKFDDREIVVALEGLLNSPPSLPSDSASARDVVGSTWAWLSGWTTPWNNKLVFKSFVKVVPSTPPLFSRFIPSSNVLEEELEDPWDKLKEFKELKDW